MRPKPVLLPPPNLVLKPKSMMVASSSTLNMVAMCFLSSALGTLARPGWITSRTYGARQRAQQYSTALGQKSPKQKKHSNSGLELHGGVAEEFCAEPGQAKPAPIAFQLPTRNPPLTISSARLHCCVHYHVKDITPCCPDASSAARCSRAKANDAAGVLVWYLRTDGAAEGGCPGSSWCG